MQANAIALIAGLLGAVATAGVFVTRAWRNKRDQQALRQRLETLLYDRAAEPDDFLPATADDAGWFDDLRAWLDAAVSSLKIRMNRGKLIEQLPDALELMISVLRSGLSIPQAIRAVAEEIPDPCGTEFASVLRRMNLGQSLPEALMYTTQRYGVFELDLVRRAAAIQMEVGGSLADLLEKTNATLRQRIRLKRQVRVLTAQSRLSGVIICLLPFAVIIGFQWLNPGYLRPLYETNVGKLFLALAFAFQASGVVAITRLSTFRI